MAAKLPAIHWLQAFDASARHLSFKEAADELHLTSSAVSQKIKLLEEYLEVSLFTRMTRSLALTSEGQDYHVIVKNILNYYQQQQREFLRRYSRRDIRISMIPFIANDIVLPALPEYQEANPDSELKIEASTSLVNFQEDDIDAAIRFGMGEWSGLVATPLCRSRIILVANPKLIEKKPVLTMSDINRHALITMRGVENAWDTVAEKHNLNEFDQCRTLEVDSYLGSMVAAQQGLGIAMGVRPLIQPWLDDGRLVQVLDLEIEIPQTYYFVRRIQDRDDLKLQQLYVWLKGLFSERERLTRAA
ncbi:LysR family transcriptional regulator [Bermanella marisrubri]|uniref:Putative glycine cleavage operon activator n=1 Tax=Bermanella marisrubri TaxID=207949 RepID=Q1MY54_9GAMM|nr:LysR substrate-binding domain-containing protein [Bermanella marisrubri]EAT10906.1 putative glycine cleavage operon activator [Oceanobacter sp. RED65] [Bermanella marisrubri]QIZ85327.1 LysR family transcriptional regulator [Bermanella marisrubri]